MHRAVPSGKLSYGFTLVELSIVLVIVGLVITGIITGQSLQHNARISKTIREAENGVQAYKLFVEKYMAQPGDIPTATSYWPSSYNGDGDGSIGCSVSTCTGGDIIETMYFWQHLSLAELYPGPFTGQWGPTGWPDEDRGVNVPKASLTDNANFRINGWYSNTVSSRLYGKRGVAIQLGRKHNTFDDTRAGVATPQEAYSIDNKIDDGLAGQGNVWGYTADNGESLDDCASSEAWQSGAINPTYMRSSSDASCAMVFWLKQW